MLRVSEKEVLKKLFGLTKQKLLEDGCVKRCSARLTEDRRRETYTDEMRNSFSIWIGKVNVKRLFGKPRP